VAGAIVEINIAETEGGAMESHEGAELVAGKGIVGDRYFDDDPDAQITLIDADQLDRINQQTGWKLTPSETRRNVVTRGIDLNQWETSRFNLGDAVLEGVELCEPCASLGASLETSDRSAVDVVKELTHSGGIRARIVEGGNIKVGDPVGE